MNTPTASRCQRIIDMIDECLAELELAPPPAVPATALVTETTLDPTVLLVTALSRR